MSTDVAPPRVTRFSIGRVFRDSFGIFGRNIIIFGIAAMAARLVVLLAPPIGDLFPAGWASWRATWIYAGLDLVASGLTEAAIVFATFQCLRGHRATVAHVALGLRSAVPMIVAGTIYSIPLHFTDLVELVFEGEGILTIALSLAGVVLAILLTVMWLVYTAAIAIEGKSVFASFGRSAELTRGRRWTIFGLFILVTIVMIAPAVVIAIATDWSPADALAEGPATAGGAIGYMYYALATAFYAVLIAVAYYYLRVEKEGVSVEDIVRVFD
jgi:hypothetical protein